jgi:hypothetical protein
MVVSKGELVVRTSWHARHKTGCTTWEKASAAIPAHNHFFFFPLAIENPLLCILITYFTKKALQKKNIYVYINFFMNLNHTSCKTIKNYIY